MIFDLAIVGGGPGGTRAAFQAAARGLSTVLVEADKLGGTCLNAGCIPTKFLLGGTAAFDLVAAQKKYRTVSGELNFSLEASQARKDKFVKGSRETLRKRLLDAGVTVLDGFGRFSGPDSLCVETAAEPVTVRFKKCILACGSKPAAYPGLAPDGDAVLDSTALLGLSEVPESLLIIGGGVIGLEMGEIFHRYGSRITVVEALDRIAATEEPEVSELLRKYHQRAGWKIHTGRKVSSLSSDKGRAVLTLDDGEQLEARYALVAVGRQSLAPAVEPEKAGICLDSKGFVQVDAFLRTTENIYALGDVNGKILLAHAADHQADYVVEHIAGEASHAYPDTAMPACIYGSMEVMRVGPTVSHLITTGHHVYTSRSDLAANAISQSYGMSQGFIKIAWVDGQIHAVSAIGHGVSHLVTLATVAVVQKWSKNSARSVIIAHPTLDEAFGSAIFDSTLQLE